VIDWAIEGENRQAGRQADRQAESLLVYVYLHGELWCICVNSSKIRTTKGGGSVRSATKAASSFSATTAGEDGTLSAFTFQVFACVYTIIYSLIISTNSPLPALCPT
jgi:hypothetical protein